MQSTRKDANGNLSTYIYDGFDRLQTLQLPSKTSPGASSTTDVEQYTYDANNNRKTLVTRDSQTISYSYDALNRLTLKQWPSTWGVSVFYGYDLRNLRLYANFGSTTGLGVSNTYDGFGNVSSATTNLSGSSRTIAYQYDADGNRRQMAYPDAAYFTYSYDGLDRLSQIFEGAATPISGYSYDTQGRRSQIARGSGVASTSYSYDGISRLHSLSHDLDGSAVTNDFAETFSYNPANQVTAATSSNTKYSYLLGNVARSFGANGLNQYVQIAGVTVTSDPRGNLLSDGSSTYGYDLENRLVSASGTHTATLTYDPNGRLYSTSGGSAGTTTFLYDGDEIVAEYNSSGSLLRRFVPGAGIDEPAVWYEGQTVQTSTRRYFYANHQNSIVAVSDASGTMLEVETYDPYGVGAAATNQSRFRYTGQAFIPELGLFYYKARIYNPALGRFMQTDPIGYTDDLNLYTYVGNDPIDRTDPSGNYALVDDLVAFFGGGIVGVGFLEARGGNPTWGDRAGAFVSGGVVGLGLLYAPPSGGLSLVATSAVIGGTAAGLGNLAKQTTNIATGEQAGFDRKELAVDTAVGTVVGAALPAFPEVRIPGLSAGAGNAKAVAEGVRTRIANGNASNMSVSTAMKGTMGAQTNEAARTTINAVAEAAKDKLCKRDGGKAPC